MLARLSWLATVILVITQSPRQMVLQYPSTHNAADLELRRGLVEIGKLWDGCVAFVWPVGYSPDLHVCDRHPTLSRVQTGLELMNN